jgi:hypothetical protein
MAYKAKNQILEDAPDATVCCMACICLKFRPLLKLFVSFCMVCMLCNYLLHGLQC